MERVAATRSRPITAAAVVLSLGLHGVAYAMIGDGRPPAAPRGSEPVEFEVVSPPPAPPVAAEAPAAPAPSPAPALPRPKPAKAPRPPPDAAPPSPTPAAKPVPLRVGITLGLTTAAGSFAVGTGNTLYGQAEERAGSPAEAKPYVAPPEKPAFVAATRVSTGPRVLREAKPEYPAEARAAGIEGDVILLLRIEREGHVSAVRVLKGPGHGLEAAAERAAWQLRFAPATLDGEPVATEIRFTYHCLLE
jgi:protein TonB